MNMSISYQQPEEALKLIQSGHRLFVHGSACTPLFLLHQLAKRKNELRNTELTFISVYGDLELDKKEYADSFHINSMFVSKSIRRAVDEGYADFIPVFLSEIPQLFRRGILPV